MYVGTGMYCYMVYMFDGHITELVQRAIWQWFLCAGS